MLGHYDIYDVDTLVAILRSPHNASQVADLIDGSRALIDATAGINHVGRPVPAAVGVCSTSLVTETISPSDAPLYIGSLAPDHFARAVAFSSVPRRS